MLLKFNKNSLSSIFKNNLFPTTSEALETNGKKRSGYAIFSNLISFKFSNDLTWSKKPVPQTIGQNSYFVALFSLLINFNFSNFCFFFFCKNHLNF